MPHWIDPAEISEEPARFKELTATCVWGPDIGAPNRAWGAEFPGLGTTPCAEQAAVQFVLVDHGCYAAFWTVEACPEHASMLVEATRPEAQTKGQEQEVVSWVHIRPRGSKLPTTPGSAIEALADAPASAPQPTAGRTPEADAELAKLETISGGHTDGEILALIAEVAASRCAQPIDYGRPLDALTAQHVTLERIAAVATRSRRYPR